ncbi:TIGR03089 family protein [Flaviflexus huanghaiensis]|uniref:TIGR03089 family protein n=1 Tax=Flaviflexus huanghaiensis TaxID=1111473 RepID=UPI0015FCA4C9
MTALTIYRKLVERGASPVLTLYGSAAGAPRLELSGRVVANHAAKAANLLAGDLMIEPGAPLRLDLPTHWRLLTWGLGGLLAGAELSSEGDTVVTTDPEADGDDVIVVALGALDMSWPGELPAGVIDGNAEVLGQADILLDESLAAPVLPRPIDGAPGRLLVVDPNPMELLDAFVAAVATGSTLVVSDAASAAKAMQAESARPLVFAG